jgi:nucleoside phosphorylase
MTDDRRILVVAATGRELAPADGWLGVTCGVGPVDAAVHTARAIAEHRPHAIVHVGIAGARRRRALAPGTLVVGTHSRYHDLGDLPPEWAPRELTTPDWLLRAVRTALPQAVACAIGTSGRVGGTTDTDDVDGDVEAMEGFGVLRAAHAAGIPAIEVRAISNEIEEQDRARWHFALAFAAITGVTPALVRAVADALGTPPHA